MIDEEPEKSGFIREEFLRLGKKRAWKSGSRDSGNPWSKINFGKKKHEMKVEETLFREQKLTKGVL